MALTANLPAYSRGLFEPHRYKVLWGGRGAARSWSVARALLIKAASSPLRILCTRELQTSIKDSVHQLLKDQIALLGIEGFEVLEREIRHANGSLFLFEGLRYNVKKVKSLEGIDICWVEEAEHITKDSWAALIPTIRKSGSEIWVTFNPDQETDATYQRFIVNTPPNTWVCHTTSEDNPWLSDELKAEREYDYKVDPDAADNIWGGKTRKISAAQILNGKWSVEPFEPIPFHTREKPCPEMQDGRRCPHGWEGPYQGIDFGFGDDPAAALRMWVFQRRLYVEYELYRFRLDIDHMPRALTSTIPDFERFQSRADSARPDSISYLKRHGIPLVSGSKKGPGSVEDGVAHLRSYEQIIIHPRCRHFRDEARLYSYKVDERSGDILPEIVDAHNHLMDCARYGLEPLIKPRRKVGVLFASIGPQRPSANTPRIS